jgi:hypothetical protein
MVEVTSTDCGKPPHLPFSGQPSRNMSKLTLTRSVSAYFYRQSTEKMDNPIPSIPSKAIYEIKQGRKLEAIRIVREAQGLDLAEAKETVETYIQSQPALQSALEAKNTEANRSVGLWLFIVIAILAVAYFFAGL